MLDGLAVCLNDGNDLPGKDVSVYRYGEIHRAGMGEIPV